MCATDNLTTHLLVNEVWVLLIEPDDHFAIELEILGRCTFGRCVFRNQEGKHLKKKQKTIPQVRLELIPGIAHKHFLISTVR